MSNLLGRKNWLRYEEGKACALYEAWWGKGITTRTIPAIPISDDIDNKYANDESPPVGVLSQPIAHTIVDIDQGLGMTPIGEILLRREFVTTLEYIQSLASRRPRSGVIVTGQPGIGKTFYLWYLLRYRLSLRLPTVSAIGERYFFFHDTGVYIASTATTTTRGGLAEDATTASDSKVWALIDTMAEMTAPPPWLVTGPLFPVQSASPNVSQYKSWMKEKSAVPYTMNPWDWVELVAGLPLQEGVDTENINHSLLQKAYDKYGPVPRNVYLAYSHGDGMTNYDRSTLTAIAHASYAQLERVAEGVDRDDGDISNKLICLRRQIPGASCATVLSRFVAEELIKAQAFADLREKRKFLRLFTAIPQMGAARRWLFEAYMHNRFSSPSDTQGGITVYTLDPVLGAAGIYRPKLHSETAGPPFPLVDRSVRVYNSPGDFLANPPTAEYHIPSAKNNPGFDSFLITGTAAYIFQMTVSRSHAADTDNQRGLHLLKQILPRNVPWHYVLVVPHITDTTDIGSTTLTSVNKDWVDAVVSFLLLVLR